MAEPYTLLGQILLQEDRRPEAETYLQQSLQIARRCFGPHYPLLATTLEALAHLAHVGGRNDTALTMMREVVTIRDKVSGSNNPSTIRAREALAEYSTR